MFNFKEKIKFQKRNIDVLTIGELLIDMISDDYGTNFECNNYTKHFGGSPANIAINIQNLGGISELVSSVGNDGLGEFLINYLYKNNINTELINRTNYSTSMVLVTKSKGTPEPIFYRNADYYIPYNNKIENAIKNSKIIHFSCWPISMNPARNTIEKVIETAKRENTLICFDPNYHDMIWEKEHDGKEYVKSIISKSDIVKPSEDDAERIFGKDTAINQINKFLKLGAKLVIMTLGKDGAIVSNEKETLNFKAYTNNVVDTTGAGDAFWSGFYTALVKNYSIEDALKLGFAVSAYKIKYIGAIAPLPSIDKIRELYGL